MRSSLLALSFLVGACGRAELANPPSLPEPVEVPAAVVNDNRVRLSSSFLSSDGFRFDDRVLLSTRTSVGRCEIVTEVRTSDGQLVEGEAARVDLQTYSGRYFTLSVPGGAFCEITRPVASLSEVLASDCAEWKTQESFFLSFSGQSMAPSALVVRTATDQAWRLRIIESGYNESSSTDGMLFEFEPLPAPAVCVTSSGCIVSSDCCSGRHTCRSGLCDY